MAQQAQRTEARVTGAWVATLTEARSSACVYGRALGLACGDAELLSSSPRTHCTALFDGVLYNRADLLGELGADLARRSAGAELPGAGAAGAHGVLRLASDEQAAGAGQAHGSGGRTDADLILLAYERWGEDLLQHVKGIFALIVWDGSRNLLLAARDPLGSYPLFWTRAGGTILFSTDVRDLLDAPSVSRAVNRLALADHLCHRWSQPEETYFEAISRVPPGHVLRFQGDDRRLARYWDPTPPGEPVNWIGEAELDEFDHRLDQAVNRCLALGRAGIFLSGGFDSVSVAAVAVDNARRLGVPSPVALSLRFPDPECNEEPVQRGVASKLGVAHDLVPFEQAIGPAGLLAASVEMAGTWPVPMLNVWNPAYRTLALLGAARGCSVILTGHGGDEWLGVSPCLAADMIARLDVAGLVRHVATLQRSFSAPRLALWRSALWTFGGRPLLSAGLGRIAPRAWRARRVRKLVASTPPFVAPDPEVRRGIDARAGGNLANPNPPDGFYLQDARTAIDHPLMAIDLEETFEMGRRLGLRLAHPYWDADLVDMLHRTPPDLLNRGGRSKGLVRQAMADRFPDLGFERHKKVAATDFFRRIIREEGPAAWRAQGGPRRLAELGVVDGRQAQAAADALLAGSEPSRLYRVWDLLALESWVRGLS